MKIMVTGAAGFIGFHLCKKLVERGDIIIAIDNFSELPYGKELKYARAEELYKHGVDVINYSIGGPMLDKLLDGVDVVCNLAALAGVRQSIKHPLEYINTNIVSFVNLLEACKDRKLKNFVFASSSSIYGKTPRFDNYYAETIQSDSPVSLYAATKKANELIAHSYSHLYGMRITGLRFFTVYGPWGRPDMALYKFVKNIVAGVPIDVYNNGDMSRDFTYIDDIIDGMVLCIDNPQEFEVFNIGRGEPQSLLDFIRVIEGCCGRKAIFNNLPMQPGDVKGSHANTDKIKQKFGYRPKVSIQDGVPSTVKWIMEYYK
jgi:UDP-glucuronate 4-epimerase